MKSTNRFNSVYSDATGIALENRHAQISIYAIAEALANDSTIEKVYADKGYQHVLESIKHIAFSQLTIPPVVDESVDKCWSNAGLPRKITKDGSTETLLRAAEQMSRDMPHMRDEPELHLSSLFVVMTYMSNNAFNVIAKKVLEKDDTYMATIANELLRIEFNDAGQRYTAHLVFSLSPFKSQATPGQTYSTMEDMDDVQEDSKEMPKFLTDMLEEAKKDPKPFIGRTQEVEDLINCLGRKDKPNAMLVGEPGVGKTDICRGLALKILDGSVAQTLKGVKFYRMDVAGMVAGSQYRGMFEERLKKTLEFLTDDENRPLVFIDETHTVIGAGSAKGSMDASNILKPYLTKGNIRFIGATTANEFKCFVEKDSAFMRRWQKVMVNEPNEQDAIAMLKGSKSAYEKFHGLKISNACCEAAVKLSEKHMHDRFLPDKAIDILDQTCSRVKNQGGKKLILDDITETVSRLCHIPKQSMDEDELEKVRHLDTKLSAQVFGQNEAIGKVVEAIQMAKIGLNDETKPIGNFLFVGPSGVGKTEIAKQLAANMGIDFLRFDMSEYMESHSVAKLIGSPAGYVGYDDGGLLIEQVRNHPHCVLLFDEIEKAHPAVFDVFLQMLDNGIVTDSKGRKADFRNTVIIMTSNAGNTNLTPKVGFGQTNEASRETSMDALRHIMRPELLGRISEENIVQVNALCPEVSRKIAKKELKMLTMRLKTKGYTVSYSDEAIDKLVELGVSSKYGARELQKAIDVHIKRLVTKQILSNKMPKNSIIVIENDKFAIQEPDVVEAPDMIAAIEQTK